MPAALTTSPSAYLGVLTSSIGTCTTVATAGSFERAITVVLSKVRAVDISSFTPSNSDDARSARTKPSEQVREGPMATFDDVPFRGTKQAVGPHMSPKSAHPHR